MARQHRARSPPARRGSRGSSPGVDAAEVLDLASRPDSAPGRPCDRAALRLLARRIGNELLRRQHRAVQIPARPRRRPPTYSSPGTPAGTGSRCASSRCDAQRWRSAGRSTGSPAASAGCRGGSGQSPRASRRRRTDCAASSRAGAPKSDRTAAVDLELLARRDDLPQADGSRSCSAGRRRPGASGPRTAGADARSPQLPRTR